LHTDEVSSPVMPHVDATPFSFVSEMLDLRNRELADKVIVIAED
jgi:hypothetical protein